MPRPNLSCSAYVTQSLGLSILIHGLAEVIVARSLTSQLCVRVLRTSMSVNADPRCEDALKSQPIDHGTCQRLNFLTRSSRNGSRLASQMSSMWLTTKMTVVIVLHIAISDRR